ncbi:PH domain-containing protein [Vagococcus vulneris]|uniref:YdbS-like PH domain-containing protein n=1 Tax=Vagococcus vulneris TaxID=1977869 RepID=A0A429ZY99_9ENTE|nr:PH domain-containing protein [Vagococcus vulneris]RST98913.1 hypothetical protein CBF37_05955 [Vagococcus vulneris]
MSERQRYHPLALVLAIVKNLKEFTFALAILIISSGFFQHSLVKFLLIGGTILFSIILAIWNYLTETYEIRDADLIVYKGVFFKKEITVPYERIQTIKQRQWFFLKLFKVVELLIDTAGNDSEPEVHLPAVSYDLLQKIEVRRQAKGTATFNTADSLASYSLLAAEKVNDRLIKQLVSESMPFYRVPNRDILMFGLTDLSIFAVVFAVYFFVDDFIPLNWIKRVTNMSEELLRMSWLMLALVIIGILIILSSISIGKQFLTLHQFTITRDSGTLITESGLLEKRIQKIPLHKIQGIKIRQQIIRRLFGLVSVELLLARGQAGDEDSTSAKRQYLLPIVKQDMLYHQLSYLLPEWQIEEPVLTYVSKDKMWYFWRWWLAIIIPLTAAGMYFYLWAAIPSLLLLLLTGFLSWLQADSQGYALQKKTWLAIQKHKCLTKELLLVEPRRLQAVKRSTSKWLRPKAMGHVEFWISCDNGTKQTVLKYLPTLDITCICQSYRQHNSKE